MEANERVSFDLVHHVEAVHASTMAIYPCQWNLPIAMTHGSGNQTQDTASLALPSYQQLNSTSRTIGLRFLATRRLLH